MRLPQNIRPVGTYDARTHLSELLKKVEAGEEFTITRHGSPIAKLVPVRKRVTANERAAAIQRIQSLGASLSLGGSKVKSKVFKRRR